MSPRRDEASERIGAVVLTVVLLLSFWAARIGVAETHAALDHRERLLAAWEQRGGREADGRQVSPDLVAMFHGPDGAGPAPGREVR